MTFTILRIATRHRLGEAFDAVGSFFVPEISRSDERRFGELDRRFDDDRPLMLVVEADGQIVGGAFGFRGAAHVTLRMIAVDPRYRRRGIGSRLVQTFEVGAMELGVRGISLGPIRTPKASTRVSAFTAGDRCTRNSLSRAVFSI